MKKEGKFIVIEGIEGCGKGTQTKILSDFLNKKGINVITKKYPEYGFPIGELINNWLYSKEYDFNPEAQTLLYFADFIKDKEVLENYLKNGKVIVSDRYFTTTIIYQKIKGFPLEKMLQLANIFDLRKPDLTIYIKISPETSFERKMKQKGIKDMDRHEKDKKFLYSLYENYEEMSRNNIFCKWTTVDGERPIEETSKDLIKIVNKLL
jgi:dTMP kinase